ncbi:hypothetical protein BDW69DRAFT_172459 [Aspergillus filifer]
MSQPTKGTTDADTVAQPQPQSSARPIFPRIPTSPAASTSAGQARITSAATLRATSATCATRGTSTSTCI